MMEIQRPIFWHQGLFLQPQHFQLLERAFNSSLIPFRTYTMPHFQGLAELEIQRAALGTRTFSILKAEAVFSDGTYAVFPGNSLIEARRFEEAWVEGDKTFSVYLGVKKWDTAGENVSVVNHLENLSAVSTRFVAATDPTEVEDLHAGGPKGQVKQLNYVLKIFWETEKDQLGDYVLIPLAQLERVGEEIRISRSYIPPAVTIGSSELLLKIVKEIRDQISSRSRQLEEYKSQRGIQTAEFGSRDMVYLLALRSLNRYVPVLFHYIEALQVHPWIVYGALRQLIGELSSFSERVTVMGETADGTRLLSAYDHQNLWECFSSAQSLITKLLDEITAGPEYVIRPIYDGAYYAVELKPALFEGRNRFYLALRTAEDPKAILQSLDTVAKLSSREHLPILIARALPGIALEHLPLPPQELPRRLNTLYFSVDIHGDPWSFVTKSNNIALYWDNAPEDLEVELMVVGR
jgi:type VI secretion system protein ImpJ